MRTAAMVVALGMAVLGASACACDRVSEPVSADPTPLTSAPPSAASTRCVKAWGATPQREAFKPGFVAPDCPTSEPPDTPPAPKEPLRTATVSFPDAAGQTGGAPSVTVEVAASGSARQRGLMMRRSLPENRGMIFVFEQRTNHEFWMHNTCVPLDMMYIDRDGFIVGIQENVPTMNDHTYAVGCPSVFVLEVNAGWSRAHGVAPGQRAKIDGL